MSEHARCSSSERRLQMFQRAIQALAGMLGIPHGDLVTPLGFPVGRQVREKQARV